MQSLSSFLITLVVTCTLYFDNMIIEFFQICLVMGQTPGEGTLPKMFFDVSRVRRRVTLSWGGQVNSLVKKFTLGYWGQEEPMNGASHIYGTCWTKEVGGGGGSDYMIPQRGTIFYGGTSTLQTPCLQKKVYLDKKNGYFPSTYHFLYFSFHSVEGYSRYKTKVKVKSNLIELKGSNGSFTYDICLKTKKFNLPPLIENTKEIRSYSIITRIIGKLFLLVSLINTQETISNFTRTCKLIVTMLKHFQNTLKKS